MYALCLAVVCSFVVLGSTREQSYEPECCKNIGGFRECRRECDKAWQERDSGKKLQLALNLPKVCPSHLVSLWKCLNSSIKGLHLYAHANLLQQGKSCCLLGIDRSCRNDCFLRTDTKDLNSCKPKLEESMLRCIERNEASQTCCQTTKRHCERACQNVFASNKAPSKKKLRRVRKNCKSKRTLHVSKCVNKVTLPKTIDPKCCKMTTIKNCQDVCREVMASKEPIDKKISAMKKACKLPFYHEMWVCFLTHAKSNTRNVNPGRELSIEDVRLHCCWRAKSDKCFQLCLKTYYKGGEIKEEFKRQCEFDPHESTMLTCMADVSQPCHIGCSGLGFCTNFNLRHTELFRSCTKEKDNAARFDYDNWLKEKRVEIHSKDVVPVKDISTCLPKMWKAVACTLQIQPCHTKSHASTICRSDCLKILGECADKEKLGVRTVEMICARLSPDDQSTCISLESYLKPSLYVNETNEVTHPCYPNPCPSQDVCEVNRESPENGNTKFVAHRCSPGCPLDQQSKQVIKNGNFARLPIVQDSKLEGCFKICRCEEGKLQSCPRLPSCVKRNSCYLKLNNNTYEHGEKFSINCNFCVCFDGEIICSKSQCLPETGNNATGRLRRNHQANDNIISGLCQCHGEYEPVCGPNRKTYRNPCLARCAGVGPKQIVKGQCSSINPCDFSPCADNKLCVVDRKVCIGRTSSCKQYLCIERPQNCKNSSSQLLCDTDNKQYSSKCELELDEKEVAYSGKCNPSCAPGVQNVCGVDGQTYSSMCALKHARMLLDYEGSCRTVGKYGNDDPSVKCNHIKCPKLSPANCVGVTPPGACCKVCATQLTILFDEKEVSTTNKIVMDNQPITQQQVVARVRNHISMSECDVFGFYNTYREFVLLVKAITEKPTTLQFLICNKEAQKIKTLIDTLSPIFTSDEILSSFRAVMLNTPTLSDQILESNDKAATIYSSSTVLFSCTLLTLILSWMR